MRRKKNKIKYINKIYIYEENNGFIYVFFFGRIVGVV